MSGAINRCGNSQQARAAGFAVWLLLSSGLAAGGSATKLNNQGVAALERGDYAAAVQSLGEALRLSPGDKRIQENYATALNNWGVELSKAGDFKTAEEKLITARQIAPDKADVDRNLVFVRVNWAVSLSVNDQFEEAEKTFNKAYETASKAVRSEIDTGRAHNLTRHARSERDQGNAERAQNLLERAVGVDPRCVPALIDLGKVRYEAGQNVAALALWESALRIQPNIPELTKRVEKLRREVRAEQGFENKANDHFIISYEGGVNDAAAQSVLNILSSARSELGESLGLYPSRRIPVVLYTKEQFADVAMAPHWSGAVYDGKIRVPWVGAPKTQQEWRRLREMLFHEYAHAAIIDVAGPEIPSWLNEGLATYYELVPRERERRYETEWRQCRDLARKGQLPGITRLPALFTTITDGEQARQAYMVSRVFVTWLRGPERMDRFQSVLKALKEGGKFEDAIRTGFGSNLEELERQWRLDLIR